MRYKFILSVCFSFFITNIGVARSLDACSDLAGHWDGIYKLKWLNFDCQYDYSAQISYADPDYQVVAVPAPKTDNNAACPLVEIPSNNFYIDALASCQDRLITVHNGYGDLSGVLAEDAKSITFNFLVNGVNPGEIKLIKQP